ncbi:DnaA/Hda family protein [Geobacter sp.]|uniref:DnaA/Hda family protein n=1 Tax=Geobacter sp. TaxID=46610 RepID=UPI002618278E|nr:DnaA/Hda family protein [Geobacter sp.]
MQLVFDFPVHEKYGFDNFVVCSGNATAFQFAQRLVDPGGTENLLYLYGPPGSGKTHLLTAIGSACSARAGLVTVPFVSFKDVDEIYGGEYPAEEVSRLAERFRNAPALLVDDLHLIPDQPSVRIELWQLFNDFYQAGRPIAITGLYPPKELPHLDGHLISRLLWGLVARVDISDEDSRRLIMKKLAEDRQIILPAEVIDYLLLHVRRDVPSLIGALEAIKRFAFSTKRKITVRLAREALALRMP